MENKRQKQLEKNLKIYLYVIIFLFVVLAIRLGWLQVVEADVLRTRAEANRIRLVTIPASRGNIITSDGVVLVTDHPSFQVSITYLGLKNQDQVVNKLAEVLEDPEITPDTINDLIKARSSRLFEPIVIKRNIPIETVTKIENYRNELPGVIIEPAPVRNYLYGDLAGHVLGYLGEINEELNQEGYEDYKLGDYIGKVGIEKQYDQYLRGHPGYRQVEVNVHNRPIREITTIAPEPGNDIVLTIDFDLQRVMDNSFDEVLENLQKDSRTKKANAGAAVLIDVKTGKILAMTTRPADNIRVQNKAIQGRYIPGSTFKMITGIAALEEGKVTPEETIYNKGAYWYPPYIKSVAPIGPMNYYTAMSKSDNTYFQEIGRRAGIDAIARIGVEFGLDKPTGIDLPYENSGSSPMQGLPTKEKREQYFQWAANTVNKRFENRIKQVEEKYQGLLAQEKNAEERTKLTRQRDSEIRTLRSQWQIDLNWNTRWHDADTFNVAIGQGRQNYTPLQLANFVAALANDGVRYKPYVVDRIVDSEGKVVQQFHPEVAGVAQVSQQSIDITKEAMRRTCQPGGTAWGLFYTFPQDIQVAAKTGTAQPGQADYKENGVQYFDGLFLAYAPADDPQIAFAGVVEFGRTGSGSAGLVAKAVFEEYFGLNQEKNE